MRRLIILFIVAFFAAARAQVPVVTVESVNSESVGLYEKFEILLNLTQADYTNPYDPDEIDVRAFFTAPSGEVWEIFGFYDDYNGRDQWKIRFAPNEIGEWRYQIQATDADGTGESAQGTFETVHSDHHGWIRVSDRHPHYFMHDDGTSFYGVGPYYPWGVSSTGLNQLEAAGCNFWGYWNISYGGEGNFIESQASGLGRYDQPKCHRIDQLIQWSEDRDLKMMLAIWPHDLLSNTVWAHQWHNNPYKDVCAVEDFYASETAWAYQEKQYRYLIARWGYSRALGVWEIVNEVNGTDGWESGRRAEATAWVGRVHDFFRANDPHGRPSTASMSGGHEWMEGYAQTDISNAHLYETGWPARYGANPLRSSLYTYHAVTSRMWEALSQPAILGEAGHTNTYGNFDARSEEYTALFHNALWASWASGLAAAPVWWDKPLMSDDAFTQMAAFSKAVGDFDYTADSFAPAEAHADDCDVYFMAGAMQGFGWVREEQGRDVSGKAFTLHGLYNGTFRITWIDPWTGEVVENHYRSAVDGDLDDVLPVSGPVRSDLAFLLSPAEVGETPVRIELNSSEKERLNDSDMSAELTAVLLDDQGRLCADSNLQVTFTVDGPGRIDGNASVTVENGSAHALFRPDSLMGTAMIVASATGLVPDTVFIEVSNRLLLDDFEDYTSMAGLNSAWTVRSGTAAQIFLDGQYTGGGDQSLKMGYAIGNGNPPYAGISMALDRDYSGATSFRFWVRPDGSDRELALLFNESNGRYWQTQVALSGTEPLMHTISLNDFISSDGRARMALDSLDELSFNVRPGSGGFGSGILWLDEIAFLTSYQSPVNPAAGHVSDRFRLSANYPNPFNNSTVIRFDLPVQSRVVLTVFDIRGCTVARLSDAVYEAGRHELLWDAGQTGSGIYVYRLEAGAFSQTRKCLLIK